MKHFMQSADTAHRRNYEAKSVAKVKARYKMPEVRGCKFRLVFAL